MDLREFAAVAAVEPDGGDLARARAAVLARLWGALSREPIPGLSGRRTASSDAGFEQAPAIRVLFLWGAE